LPITADEFIHHYPLLYHMAEAQSWPSIRKNGLLSTTALLDLFQVRGELRRSLESKHRPESVEIRHAKYGVAVIRDQKPMRERALAECLVGMTPEQWYRTLNRHVFFWVAPHRLENLLRARAYRDRTHTVITVDTGRLFEFHRPNLRLSPINSGSTIYNPRPRGANTFQRIADYPFEDRRKARGLANAVAELAVQYAVPDISQCAVRVDHRRDGRVIEIIYRETK
jgi:hypothetical protein